MDIKYIPGDLVMVDGFNTLYKITDVESEPHSDDFLYTLDPIGIGPILFNLPIDSFDSIPLTPKILEKNGWKFTRGFYCSPNKEGIGIKLVSQTGYGWKAYTGSCNLLHLNINSVSDLQHLLFGLRINNNMEV